MSRRGRDHRDALLLDGGGRAEKLLIPFVTAGYPDLASCERVLAGSRSAGADLIELGVPFSDPLADGPVIAAASEIALAAGTSLSSAIDMAARHAADAPPIVLFTYFNPVASLGVERAARACVDAGVAAVLVADLPFDEGTEFRGVLEDHGLPVIRLAAPTTPTERLVELGRGASGFVYLIARTGVTGAGEGLDPRLVEQIETLRSVTDVPIVVGFGIQNGDDARRGAEVADGVVVGTALVQRMGEQGPEAALEWLRTLREALDHG